MRLQCVCMRHFPLEFYIAKRSKRDRHQRSKCKNMAIEKVKEKLKNPIVRFWLFTSNAYSSENGQNIFASTCNSADAYACTQWYKLRFYPRWQPFSWLLVAVMILYKSPKNTFLFCTQISKKFTFVYSVRFYCNVCRWKYASKCHGLAFTVMRCHCKIDAMPLTCESVKIKYTRVKKMFKPKKTQQNSKMPRTIVCVAGKFAI